MSAMKLAGVIGWPIAHSLSPALHAYWLRDLGLSGAYVPLAVRREDFARVLDSLRRAGFAGVNVTVPHKEAAFALADDADETARSAGAANLLLFGPDGRMTARNTDVDGLVMSAREELDATRIHGQPAVVLGAGGAARAAVLALDRLGTSEIRLVARPQAKGGTLSVALKPYVRAPLQVFGWQDFPQAANGAALLINATSGGMAGGSKLNLALEPLAAEAAVADLVYNPLETEFMAQARTRGLRAINGLGMLMHQAVPAFAAFYGATPKVTPALRVVLEKALAP
jgi:shikimate dehydrogenase